MTAFLVLPRVRIHNANAMSSPFTIGFPAMTAWLGGVHALQRKLNDRGIPVTFGAVGIVSHEFNLQTYKGAQDYVHSIIGTANPLEKDGKRSAFIEEARCHLTVSVVIDFEGISKLEEADLTQHANELLLSTMKFSGGDISGNEPLFITRDFDHLKTSLMPGYALIERRDLIEKSMQEGSDALDAIIDYTCIHNACVKPNDSTNDEEFEWVRKRKDTGDRGETGWIVPIATGFQGISDLGEAKNQRDPDTPHRFAESVVTLGEFKMAYRLTTPDNLLWRYHYIEDRNLYLCEQRNNHPIHASLEISEDGF